MACKYKYNNNWYSEEEVKNQIFKDISLEDVVVELSTQMSFTVEINTAKEPTINKNVDYENDGIFDEDGNFQSENTTFNVNGYLYEKDKFKHIPFGYGKIKSEDGYIGNNDWESISEREYEEALDEFKSKEGNERPTQYYSNLTVPGGTNYTENEIATPAITPSIKGHAQFSTNNGIGWFRSDEQDKTIRTPITSANELPDEFKGLNGYTYTKWGKGWLITHPDYDESELETDTKELIEIYNYSSQKYEGSKTRRILEVQSDWGQKQRKQSDPNMMINFNETKFLQDLQYAGDLKIECD